MGCSESKASPSPDPEQLGASLRAAVSKGNQKDVEQLLRTHPSVSFVDVPDPKTQETALILAAKDGNLPIMDLLLDKKANPDLQDKNGATALPLALSKSGKEAASATDPSRPKAPGTKEGPLNMVKLLLEKKANPSLPDSKNWCALTLALAKGYDDDVVEVLLEGRADPNVMTEKGVTALLLATKEGKRDVVERLLKQGAKVNLQGQENMSALMLAVQKEHLELIKEVLLKQKADPNLKAKNGESALVLAAPKADPGTRDGLVTLLLNERAVPDIKGVGNESPLTIAAFRGFHNTVDLLLKARADPLFKFHSVEPSSSREKPKTFPQTAWTSAMQAVTEGRLHSDECLLLLQAAIRERFFAAAKEGKEEWLQSFLSFAETEEQWHGFIDTVETKSNRTALMLAAEAGHFGVVDQLLKSGADPYAEVVDKLPEGGTGESRTALLCAIRRAMDLVNGAASTAQLVVVDRILEGMPLGSAVRSEAVGRAMICLIKGAKRRPEENLRLVKTLYNGGADLNLLVQNNAKAPESAESALSHIWQTKCTLDKCECKEVGQVCIAYLEEHIDACAKAGELLRAYAEQPHTKNEVVELLQGHELAKIDEVPRPVPRQVPRDDLKDSSRLSPTALNSQDADGMTALMLAAKWGQKDLLKYLIEQKADVDKGNSHQVTALMLAATTGRERLVARLLRARANVHLKDDHSQTAYDRAFVHNYMDICKLLLPEKKEGEPPQTAELDSDLEEEAMGLLKEATGLPKETTSLNY